MLLHSALTKLFLIIKSWSKLMAPLVNMIKTGCKKYICIVYPFDLSFTKFTKI